MKAPRLISLLSLALVSGCLVSCRSEQPISKKQEEQKTPPAPEVRGIARAQDDAEAYNLIISALYEHKELVEQWRHGPAEDDVEQVLKFGAISSRLLELGASGQVAVLLLWDSGVASADENLHWARLKAIQALGRDGLYVSANSPALFCIRLTIRRAKDANPDELSGLLKLLADEEDEVRSELKVALDL